MLLALALTGFLFLARATSATVDQLLPWVTSNSSDFGTLFSDFAKAHPTAQNTSFNERPPGEPFNGGMLEELPDGSVFLYGFIDDRLASINWASGTRVNILERVRAVRNDLLRTHGQPTIETGARVDSSGSIARFIREVYRPPTEPDYVICLNATSEGVEVALTNEAIQRKHGIKTTRQTYEEAARAVSSVVPPNEKPSALVDYLAAERAKAETPPPDAQPKSPTPELPAPSTPVPTATPAPTTPVAQTPAIAAERRSPVWPWVVGILALVVIVAFALKRRA
jgi:hypothetical protein